MSIAYLYVILALLSWTVLGVFYKLAELRRCRPVVINVLLSFWASIFLYAGGIFNGRPSFEAPRFVVLLALAFGVNSATAVVAVQHALTAGKLSTTWLAIHMATGASTFGAILIYHEAVTFWKGLALMMMGVATVLLWKDMRAEEARQPDTNAPSGIIR